MLVTCKIDQVEIVCYFEVLLRDMVKPSLYLYCGFSGRTLPLVTREIQRRTPVSTLRSLVVRSTGLPVGVFRLLTGTGAEMHDCNTLDMYGIKVSPCCSNHSKNIHQSCI